jgi:hypothetical protein
MGTAADAAHDYVGAQFDAALRATLAGLRPSPLPSSPRASSLAPPRVLYADAVTKASRYGLESKRTVIAAAEPAALLLCVGRDYAAPRRALLLEHVAELWLLDDDHSRLVVHVSAATAAPASPNAAAAAATPMSPKDGAAAAPDGGAAAAAHDIDLRLASAERREQLVAALQAAAAGEARVLPTRRLSARDARVSGVAKASAVAAKASASASAIAAKASAGASMAWNKFSALVSPKKGAETAR